MPSSADTVATAADPRLHHVHLYALIRLKVENVEAPTPGAAAEAATKQVDLHDIFDRELRDRSDGVRTIDYAEDVLYYLVDPLGVEHLEPSVTLDRHYQPIDDSLPRYSAAGHTVVRAAADGGTPETIYSFAKTRTGAVHAQNVAAMLNAASHQ